MAKTRIAIVGPDNTGKHAIGKALSKKRKLEVIEATGYTNSKSLVLRIWSIDEIAEDIMRKTK